jgi:hypothetical protein
LTLAHPSRQKKRKKWGGGWVLYHVQVVRKLKNISLMNKKQGTVNIEYQTTSIFRDLNP